MKRIAVPLVIDVGRGQVILSEFKDRTSLAINIGHCGQSVLLSQEQKIELAKALFESARR